MSADRGARAPRIDAAYALAREQYAEVGVDTDAALARLSGVQLSLPCWQGDDVRGFELPRGGRGGGGILATGGHPGRARTPDELRTDLEVALRLVPGRHRVNLHAMYGEFGDVAVDRDAIEAEHFAGWVAWAARSGLGLDFNATLFAHPRADVGVTLASADPGTRAFWIAHVRRCRAITADIGRSLGTPCLHDLWLPDGMKDQCVDRAGFRARLVSALDECFADRHDPTCMLDALEAKLFGIGSESFVVGSHELYLGYAITRGVMPCLDMGHFHPTESVADKVSALLPFVPRLLVHVSRGVRWDSDHVPVLDDALRELALEIVRADALDRVYLALDFFDASLDRVGAWVVGARATLQALLSALLEPRDRLLACERDGDLLGRLALLEHAKALPVGAVWDLHCVRQAVPPGLDWLGDVRTHARKTGDRQG